MGVNFKCRKCGKSARLPKEAKVCPFCGGKITSNAQAKKTALIKINELKKMHPELIKKYNEFAQVYADFKLISETLRTYAARGIIERDAFLDFHPPKTLTEIFYEKRKRK